MEDTMKVILSRKGFDTENGGYPSPILHDGRLLSLPIPSIPDSTRYSRLNFDQHKTYYDLMLELNRKIRFKAIGDKESKWHELEPSTECHLDPDIYPGVIERHKEWRPLFGQTGTAQKHLTEQNVSKGDLFLFFGKFRKTSSIAGKISFDSSDEGRHLIFGYFQIGEIIPILKTRNIPDWMLYHSHASPSGRSENNTIYVVRERLSWNNLLPGAGAFSFKGTLVLTKEGCSCSKWQLPDCFQGINISYHDRSCWKNGYFQSRARGQEFVIEENSKIEEWAKELINKNVI